MYETLAAHHRSPQIKTAFLRVGGLCSPYQDASVQVLFLCILADSRSGFKYMSNLVRVLGPALSVRGIWGVSYQT